jgi:hypothetical protein
VRVVGEVQVEDPARPAEQCADFIALRSSR